MNYLEAQKRQQLVNGPAETPQELAIEDRGLAEIVTPFGGERIPIRLSSNKQVEVIPGDQVLEEHLAIIRNESRRTQVEYGGYAWEEKPFRDVVAYYDKQVQQGKLFVALADNYPAGMVGLSSSPTSAWKDQHTEEAIYLLRLTVLQAYRGTNLAAALIAWTKDVASTEGFSKLRLDCDSDSRLVLRRKSFFTHN